MRKFKKKKQPKLRIPVAPSGYVIKPKTEYNRKENKKIIERELDDFREEN